MAQKGKGARQQAVRRARVAAAQSEAVRHHDKRRRVIVAVILGVLVISVVVGAAVTTRSTKSSASGSSQQCVAMTDLPPAGAPYVPVHVGPAPTKLVTEELRQGTGPAVQPGDSITVNYIGVNCTDGKIFDSSYSRGQPVPLSLADVIKGWQQGIPGMQAGGQRLLGIPPDLAYGAPGRPGIAPNATLWFVVELMSIDGPASTVPAAVPDTADTSGTTTTVPTSAPAVTPSS